MVTALRAARLRGAPLILIAYLSAFPGCAEKERPPAPVMSPPRVFVVAPVLNLSGSQDFDALKVTDLVASEFLEFPNVTVVPVNLTLAELARRGKQAVETPADAVELARVLGADATIVTAITEYSPYAPPVIGLIMQWYASSPAAIGATGEPAVSEATTVLSDETRLAPRWQVQRVYNAADEQVLEQIRSFADAREGHESPYGWRRYVRSQELYVRYATWAMIRTMLKLDKNEDTAHEPSETKS